ncbi:phosphoglucomutase [Arthrobacter sp. Hiyo8]|nr:phosphoglucomutase [Arthrobacter sp. Hiyo8]
MASRAGTVALPQDLVDITALLDAYYDVTPDLSDPAQRVAFGTSGHRGSSLKASFNEGHILAITQAIVEYRAGKASPAHSSWPRTPTGSANRRRIPPLRSSPPTVSTY